MPVLERKRVYRGPKTQGNWWEVVILDHSNGCCGPWYKLIARDEKGREWVRMDNVSLDVLREAYQELLEDLETSSEEA